MAGKPFHTPAKERSFSGLVDRAISETGKPQGLLSCIQYANLVVRECQTLGLFPGDLIEDEIVATADPHIWTKPKNLRSLRAIRYSLSGAYPKLLLPGKIQKGKTEYFYSADDYFVFKGIMYQASEVIQYAAYFWARPLFYYSRLGTDSATYIGGPYDVRPAYYDEELQAWYYLNLAGTAYVTTLADTVVEASRRSLAINWLISEWWDVALEGVKAKLFKLYNDDRSGVSYALYKEGQKLFQRTAAFEGEITVQPVGGE